MPNTVSPARNRQWTTLDCVDLLSPRFTAVNEILDTDTGNQARSAAPGGPGGSYFYRDTLCSAQYLPSTTIPFDVDHLTIRPCCPPPLGRRPTCPRQSGRSRCKAWWCSVCGGIRAHDDLGSQAAALAAWGRPAAWRVTTTALGPTSLWQALTTLQEAEQNYLLSIPVIEPNPTGTPPGLHVHAVASVRDLEGSDLADLLGATFHLSAAQRDTGAVWASMLPAPRYLAQSPLQAAQRLLRYQIKRYTDPCTSAWHLELNRRKPSHLPPGLPRLSTAPPTCPCCPRH